MPKETKPVSLPERALPSDRFVWPPKPSEAVGSDAAGPAAAQQPASSVRKSLRGQACVGIEREFLRPTIEPIERQARDLGWVRDTIEAYCQRCGRTTGPHEEDEFGCSDCRGSVSPIDRTIRLGEYAAPLDRWIWALKFQRIRSFGRYLGRELAGSLRESGLLANIPSGGVQIQPMPTSRRRLLARGIDHAEVIAAALAAELRVPLIHALRRTHRPSQRSLAPSERWANAQGSLAVPLKHQNALTGSRIVLIDDVRTTGATGRAGALALKGQPDARYSPASWAAGEVWLAIVAAAE